MAKTVRVMLNLEPSMAERVAEFASYEKLSMQDAYRLLIREALNNRADSTYAPMVAEVTAASASWIVSEVRAVLEAESDRLSFEIAEIGKKVDDYEG